VVHSLGIEIEGPHEVVHRELCPIFEQLAQPNVPVWTFKIVGLVDSNHWQSAAVCVEPVTSAGELLLLRQQLQASGEPILA
jgi:hypothetical protein